MTTFPANMPENVQELPEDQLKKVSGGNSSYDDLEGGAVFGENGVAHCCYCGASYSSVISDPNKPLEMLILCLSCQRTYRLDQAVWY